MANQTTDIMRHGLNTSQISSVGINAPSISNTNSGSSQLDIFQTQIATLTRRVDELSRFNHNSRNKQLSNRSRSDLCR